MKTISELEEERLENAINAAKSIGVVIRQNTTDFRNNVVDVQESEGVSLLQAKALEILRITNEQSKNATADFQRSKSKK